MKKIVKEFMNKENIPIITFLLTIIVFYINVCLYCYEWGRYSFWGINPIYIEIEKAGKIYSFFMYFCIAIIIIVSNYIFYLYLKRKNIVMFINYYILEILIFQLIICMVEEINFWDILIEVIKFNLISEFFMMLLKMIIVIFLVNCYGIVLGIMDRKSKESLFADSKWGVILGISAGIILTPLFCFTEGRNEAENKKGFKVIINTVEEKEERREDTYFKGNNGFSQILVILEENIDNYIVTYLYNNSDGTVELRPGTIMVVDKGNMETRYIENIYGINEKNRIREQENNVDVKEYVEMNEVIVTGIMSLISALIGGIFTYRATKKSLDNEEAVNKQFSATLLYYDLKSIEKYIREKNKEVNLRYSSDWQKILTQCTFLDDENIEHIYNIYDAVYDYNEIYAQDKKGKINEKYKKILKLILLNGEEYTEQYKRIIECLKYNTRNNANNSNDMGERSDVTKFLSL